MEEVELDNQFEAELVSGGTEEILEQTQLNTVMLMRIYDALMLIALNGAGGVEQKSRVEKLADLHERGGVLSDGIKWDPGAQ